MPVAIAMLVVQHADDALRGKIPPQRWQELAAMTQSVHTVDVFTLDSSGAHLGANLMKCLPGVCELRISPTSNAVIIVTGGTNGNRYCQLWAVPADSSHAPLLVTSQSSWFPDWTPDGRGVVYVESSGQRPGDDATSMEPGALYRVDVIGNDGKMLNQPVSPNGQSSRDCLAGMICTTLSRVRCLTDGQIIFSSVELTLPCADKDVPERSELFAVDGKIATVRRLLPLETVASIGDSAEFFEPSPDGKSVSIPDRSGKVDVVELSTGTLTEVQTKPMPGKGSDQRLFSVPTWRNANELTFVAPVDGQRPSVILWSISDKKGKTLSTDWPGKDLTDIPAAQPAAGQR
jgi:hypothetical protein